MAVNFSEKTYHCEPRSDSHRVTEEGTGRLHPDVGGDLGGGAEGT